MHGIRLTGLSGVYSQQRWGSPFCVCTDNEIDVSITKSMRSSNLCKQLRLCTKFGIHIYSCIPSGLADVQKNYTPAAQSNRYEITFIYNGLHGGCRIMRIIEPFG